MSEIQRAVVERAERLTRERIAPRANEYDAAAANPIESWRDLWSEGLLAGAIPASHGGLGLDMATYIAVIRAHSSTRSAPRRRRNAISTRSCATASSSAAGAASRQ